MGVYLPAWTSRWGEMIWLEYIQPNRNRCETFVWHCSSLERCSLPHLSLLSGWNKKRKGQRKENLCSSVMLEHVLWPSGHSVPRLGVPFCFLLAKSDSVWWILGDSLPQGLTAAPFQSALCALGDQSSQIVMGPRSSAWKGVFGGTPHW